MNPYRVDISSILETLGESVEVSDTLTLEKLVVGAEEFVATAPFRFDVTITNTGTAVIAAGSIVAPVTATCARCLCEFPTEIVAAIKSKLGRDFRAFERIDEQSHQAAANLAKRAAAKDLTGSAKAFGGLTEGCLSCHKQFRAALRPLSD